MVDAFIVDVLHRSCTCRKWDITGIPCHHAIACLEFLKLKSEDYVHECYKKKAYLSSYEGQIMPSPSEKFWPKKDFSLDPPPLKIQTGRPKKNRRRDPHEDPKKPGKLTKHGVQMRCSKCRSLGHNKRSCVKESDLHPTTKIARGEASHTNERGFINRRRRERGNGLGGNKEGRGRSERLHNGGVGIIYRESGDILYRSLSGQAHALLTSSQTSQQVYPSCPYMDSHSSAG